MKKEGNSQAVKVIGKNCKWNIWYNLNRSKTYCFHTMKTCGQNNTCDCYDTAGKLQFQVKEETNVLPIVDSVFHIFSLKKMLDSILKLSEEPNEKIQT